MRTRCISCSQRMRHGKAQPLATSVWRRLAQRSYEGRFETTSGALEYRLYPPASRSGGEMSLVVMLHGAGQDPGDFALGTRMHEHAGAGDTWVLYPGQNRDVPLRCWSWFVAQDQMRGQGEPAMLVALTRFIVAEHDISPQAHLCGGTLGGRRNGGRAGADISGRVCSRRLAFRVAVRGSSGCLFGARRHGARSCRFVAIAKGLRAGADDRLSRRCRQNGSSDQRIGDRRRCGRRLRQGPRANCDKTRSQRRLARAHDHDVSPIRAAARASSNGSFTKPGTRGRAGRRKVPAPTPQARMRRARCCAFSIRICSSRAASDDAARRSRTVAAR